MTSSRILELTKSAEVSIKHRDYQSAHQSLLKILQINPKYADAFFLLAKIPLEVRNIDKAIELIERAIKLSPQNPKYQVYLTKCFAIKGDIPKTAQWAEKAINNKPDSAFDFDILGVAYSRIGLHEKAKEQFLKAISLNSNESNFHYNLASSLKFLSEFETARNTYEKAISINPRHFKAHSALTGLGGITSQNNHIERLSTLISETEDPVDLLLLSHALASEYEALNQHKKAFKILDEAKCRRIDQLGYSFNEDEEMFQSLTNIFSDANIQFSKGFDTEKAIFVVGMPRTGTTLVERIISNHTKVKSAGELHNFEILLRQMSQLSNTKIVTKNSMNRASNIDFFKLGQAYIESVYPLTGETDRFVDKLPLNVLHAGFISKALPRCKIICLDRNPLDTIVSNYRQIFAPQYSYCNYSNSLETTTQFYLLFKQLVSLWQRLFPDNFCLVSYENLVNNPETEAKKIIEFCGLDWQAQCLEIHENTEPVATASAVQVRQPINNSSVGNWKKYDMYLLEVKRILKSAGVI